MEKMETKLREAGQLKGETLYDVENVSTVHHVNQGLRAHKLFTRDKDYIVRNGEVVIIDEFTGRMMPGRRYSEGLHQALEAKEHVTVQPENATLASITFQNYFRLYAKLAGMTGTAATEADEFFQIYKLEVVEIPTNVPISRKDEDDEVYRTFEEKVRGVIREIQAAQANGQPLLGRAARAHGAGLDAQPAREAAQAGDLQAALVDDHGHAGPLVRKAQRHLLAIGEQDGFVDAAAQVVDGHACGRVQPGTTQAGERGVATRHERVAPVAHRIGAQQQRQLGIAHAHATRGPADAG
jgi:hypothetical protein